MPYRPGQFVTIGVTVRTGSAAHVVYRSYSLCGDGRADQPWEITVKRQPGGVVSSYLHDCVGPGMFVAVSQPGGQFTLPQSIRSDTPLVFVAAGSGITPIYAMLRALAALPADQRPRVHLHYAYHSPADAMYGAALDALDPQQRWLRQWRYVSTDGRRMSPQGPLHALGAYASVAQWYLCGPDTLMQSVYSAAQLAGVPADQLHRERFVSRHDAPNRPVQNEAASASIRIAETGATLDAHANESLLETLERYGYEVDYSCRAGSCGTCRLRLLAGRVRNPDGQALTSAERAAGYVETCVAEPTGLVTIALDGAVALPAVAAPGRTSPAARRNQRAVSGRAATRRRARWTLVATSAALFALAWNLTSHKVPASATGTAAIKGYIRGLLAGDDGQGGSNFNSSPFQNLPTNSGTGVS